ncbi:MAG: HAD family hydrolase [Angelakisella sp.]
MKLFASDLDGTLLDSRHAISKVNLEAIGALEDSGVTFAIATGRAYLDVVDIMTKYHLHAAVICCNGACVYGDDGKIISKNALPLSLLNEICAMLTRSDIFFALNSPVTINVKPDWEDALEKERPYAAEADFAAMKSEFMSQAGLRYVDSYDEFFCGESDCCSISVMCMAKEKLERLTSFARTKESISLTSSGNGSLEIALKGSSKADGLRHLAGSMGIAMSETGAAGDNFNDLELLEVAAVSFAMENAPDEIKRITHFVTSSNEQNGVAEAINIIINGGHSK